MKLKNLIFYLMLGYADQDSTLLNLISNHIVDTYGENTTEHELWRQINVDKVLLSGLKFDKAATISNIVNKLISSTDDSYSKNYPRFQALSEELYFSVSGSGDGTPCENQQKCDELARRMSICANLREMSNQISNFIRAANNVLSSAMLILCACLFAGPLQLCILKNFAYTCVYPYQLYGTFINFGNAIWESTKTISTMCSIMGDPTSLIPINE